MKNIVLIMLIVIGSNVFASPYQDGAYLKGQQRYKMFVMSKGYKPSKAFCVEKANIIAQLQRKKNPFGSKFPKDYFILGCLGK